LARDVVLDEVFWTNAQPLVDELNDLAAKKRQVADDDHRLASRLSFPARASYAMEMNLLVPDGLREIPLLSQTFHE
jgi:hypothetical protein